jgi:hypothetical protein
VRIGEWVTAAGRRRYLGAGLARRCFLPLVLWWGGDGDSGGWDGAWVFVRGSLCLSKTSDRAVFVLVARRLEAAGTFTGLEDVGTAVMQVGEFFSEWDCDAEVEGTAGVGAISEAFSLCRLCTGECGARSAECEVEEGAKSAEDSEVGIAHPTN